MTKQPNLQLAQQLLADWWLNNTEVTSLQFKEELRSEYPDHIWNQQWVSHFLSQTDHEWADKGNYRLYFRSQVIKTSQPAQVGSLLSVITVSVTQAALKLAGEMGAGLISSKKEIKDVLKDFSKVNDFSNFEEEFVVSNWHFSGKYTGDNKKLYVWLADDEYWSQSKQEILKLANMPKAHIKNSLLKRYSGVNIEEILNDPNKEAVKLLKAYLR